MLKLISRRRAERILRSCGPRIRELSRKYRIPAPVIQAILYQEMTQIDLLDLAADLAVWTNLFPKKDSSTGYAQIFGYVGIRAVNFAVDRGLTDYAALGISADHRLDSQNPKDVRRIWLLLHRDPRANLEIATLNLLSAAEEMTGRIDFEHYSEEELKRVLTRYNANVQSVTAYGEAVYRHVQRYRQSAL